MPFQSFARVLAAVMTLIACTWYTTAVEPDIQLRRFVLKTKLEWAKHLHGAPKYIVFGGSSCAFGIEPRRLIDKHHIPAANLGINASFGPELITRLAIEAAEPGDTLVMSMEPDLLEGSLSHPAAAVQFAYAYRRPDFLDGISAAAKRDSLREVLALRPMALHSFAMLGKIIARRPLFRYSESDAHPDGFMTTSLREPHTASPELRLPTNDFIHFLTQFRDRMRTRNISVVYTAPWMSVLPQHLDMSRRSQARALVRIAAIVPVLRDETLGAIADPSLFADTEFHLTAEGAAQRTDQLADLLKHNRTWTVQELESFAFGI